MEANFVCDFCGNSDRKFLGLKNGRYYCRKCIEFKGERAEEPFTFLTSTKAEYCYELSKEQKRISLKLIENYKNHIDTLIHAVCGAGKTELVFDLIASALSKGHVVGFAIPRKDVVIELKERFDSIFPYMKPIAVYGGSTSEIDSNFLILTTHQLYRYQKYFDLLIIDEIDAFPFHNNDVLHHMYRRAIRGTSILLTATPSNEILKEYQGKGKEILTLYKRYHGHDLPVPQIVIKIGFLKYFFLVNKLKNFITMKKKVFVFTPTIDICEELYQIVKVFVPGGNVVHSKAKERERIIKDFKNGKYHYLITSAVLERGVTVENLQVIVFKSDHKIYDKHSLIQISGRVGRKKNAPTGDVLFLTSKVTSAMKEAINEIKMANESKE